MTGVKGLGQKKMLTLDMRVLPVADGVQVLCPRQQEEPGFTSQFTTEETCSMYYIILGYDICAVFPRSAMLLSPLVYPVGTLCHYTNSICQQSAADKPQDTILASATSGLGPCCLAKQLLDGLRDSLLLAISTTLE